MFEECAPICMGSMSTLEKERRMLPHVINHGESEHARKNVSDIITALHTHTHIHAYAQGIVTTIFYVEKWAGWCEGRFTEGELPCIIFS